MNSITEKLLYTLIASAVLITVASAASVSDILDSDYDTLEMPMSLSGRRPVATVSAEMAYVWSQSGGQAMVLLGQFHLRLPYQTLSGDSAVIWMSMDRKSERRLKKLEIFIEGNARVVERAGAIMTDKEMLLTVHTAAQIELEAGALARRDGSGQAIYKRALDARARSTIPAVTAKADKPGGKATGQIVVHAPFKKDKAHTAPEKKETPRVPRPIIYRGQFEIRPKADPPVLLLTDGAYLLQAAEPGGEATELRATNAVVFLKPGAMKANVLAAKPKGEVASTRATQATTEQIKKKLAELPTEDEAAQETRTAAGFDQSKIGELISAVYLEGDVVLSRGYRQIRADAIYYDFDNSRALIDNMVASTDIPSRNVPVYIRASRARQLSETSYVAYDAKVSTSEFYTPSYHVGATKVYFDDRTEYLETGEQLGLVAGEFKAHNATFNIAGLPILYWPFIHGDFKQSETSLRNARFSYDSEFGATGKTRWHLFPVLGLDEPDGTDGTLRLDYYGDRGPAVGIDLDYERKEYLGLLRSYYIHDTGKDELGGIRGTVEPPYENRGRVLIRHKHFLEDKWELTLEFSYLSDRNFLEEYFASEFREGKEQETVIYIKKSLDDDMLFSALAKWRINDFLTQTEKLPEAYFDVLGKRLFGDALTWYSGNRVGAVRYRVDHDPPIRGFFTPGFFFDRIDPRLDDTSTTARLDSRQEIDTTFSIGSMNFVPFGTVRGTYWGDTPYDGGLGRFYGAYGLKGSAYQWRVYDDVESRMFDLHRLRHVMKEDFIVWGAHSNVDPSQLTPFDTDVEYLSEVDGFAFGWRHIFQTKRGRPDNWRSVDWLTIDIEAAFFNDADQTDGRNTTRGQVFSFRPEESITSNHISLRSIYRISDTTALLYDAILDANNWRMGTSGLGIHVDRDPRLSWFLGHRYIGQTRSNLLGFGANYRLNSKYTIALREEFDLDRGENADIAVSFIRKLPRWYLALTFEVDETENVDSISISIWPEGIPEWTMGSRRYTGLETSTGIKP